MCDGEPQCQDRSDEADCYEKADGCSHHCDKGSRCIPESFLCDGERDCLDGSDEAQCGTTNRKHLTGCPVKCSQGAEFEYCIVMVNIAFWAIWDFCCITSSGHWAISRLLVCSSYNALMGQSGSCIPAVAL